MINEPENIEYSLNDIEPILISILLILARQQIDLSLQVKSLEILWSYLRNGIYPMHAPVIFLNFRVKFAMMT